MNNFKGFAELQNAQNLVEKLKFDLERLQNSPSPQDQYAAFDFFVTAEHILDWIYLNTDAKKHRKEHLLLQITSHIANSSQNILKPTIHVTSLSKMSEKTDM